MPFSATNSTGDDKSSKPKSPFGSVISLAASMGNPSSWKAPYRKELVQRIALPSLSCRSVAGLELDCNRNQTETFARLLVCVTPGCKYLCCSTTRQLGGQLSQGGSDEFFVLEQGHNVDVLERAKAGALKTELLICGWLTPQHDTTRHDTTRHDTTQY